MRECRWAMVTFLITKCDISRAVTTSAIMSDNDRDCKGTPAKPENKENGRL